MKDNKPVIGLSDDKLLEEEPVEETQNNKEPVVAEDIEDEQVGEDTEITQPNTLEEKLAYQKLKNKILKWKRSFPDETSIFVFDEQANIPYQELVDLEKQIEYAVGTANAGSMIQSSVVGVATVIESKASSIGMNLQGYSTILMMNENFKKTLLELECIYGGNYSNPFYRVASTMFYTAGVLHVTNTQKLRAEMKDKLSKDFEGKEKYSDL